MKKLMISALALALLLSACGRQTTQPSPPAQAVGAAAFGDSAAFELTVEEFTSVFSELYAQDCPSSPEEWVPVSERADVLTGVLNPGVSYSGSDELYGLPSVTVFSAEQGVTRVELCFDDHGYQQRLYERFENMCLAALGTFLPLRKQLPPVFEALYALAGDIFSAEDESYLPEELFCEGEVGFYAFYGEGTVNICIVPVPEEFGGSLSRRGVTVRELDELLNERD